MQLGDLQVSSQLQGKEDIFFGEREQKFLLASAPKSKVSLTLGHEFGPVSSNLRLTRFDEVELIDFVDTPDIYQPAITTDVTVAWKINKRLRLIVGGSNIFNVYPPSRILRPKLVGCGMRSRWASPDRSTMPS